MASEVQNDSKETPHLYKTPSAKNKTKPHPLDVSVIQATPMDKNKDRGPVTPKTNKIGHRRVDEAGETTYKKTPSSALMKAIQLGIGHSFSSRTGCWMVPALDSQGYSRIRSALRLVSLSSKPERDVLMQDFAVVESVWFPSEGSGQTPAHQYSDFRFKAYAPVAFRFFRELFGIRPADFLMSLSHEPLVELSNPGASGSVFYVSNDDEFIIKTVQHKEAEFLIKLLPGYYLNLSQNKRTLLPKFFGLYCYQCGGKNIRLVVMNNLLPRGYKMHIKYDLKGSTYKRRASKTERAKETPTHKDLDFRNDRPEGILLESATYNQVIHSIQRDCRVLESFKIMDFSLLVGIHNLDETARERQRLKKVKGKSLIEQVKTALQVSAQSNKAVQSTFESPPVQPIATATDTVGKSPDGPEAPSGLKRKYSAKAREGFGAAMEAIQLRGIEDDEDRPPGGIPARNGKGERLILFVGVIDILQNYRFKKKIEHGWKSLVHDGDTVSVHRPSFYAKRFIDFMSDVVFKKMPTKGSPNKRKLMGALARSRSVTDADKSRGSSDPKHHARTEPLDRYRSHSISEGDRSRPIVRLNLNASSAADGSFIEQKSEVHVTLATEEEMSSPGTPSTVKRRSSEPAHSVVKMQGVQEEPSTSVTNTNEKTPSVDETLEGSSRQENEPPQDQDLGDEQKEVLDINSISLTIVSVPNGTSKKLDDVVSQDTTELTSL